VIWHYQTAIEYVIAALNRDIMREIRMADDCIQFEGMALGTTTLRVVRHAPCPVLTVGAQHERRQER